MNGPLADAAAKLLAANDTGALDAALWQTLRQALAEPDHEDQRWRQFAAFLYSGPSRLYTDDGELQDSSAAPFIDWRRDGQDMILRAIYQRNVAAMSKAFDQPGGTPDVRQVAKTEQQVTVALQQRIDAALELAPTGSYDGAHHKMWVIDQMVRKLTGDGYVDWVQNFEGGEDGPATYTWDVGIPP